MTDMNICLMMMLTRLVQLFRMQEMGRVALATPERGTMDILGTARMPDQYQKEIEDILKKAEAEAPLPSGNSRHSLRGMVWQYVRQSLNSKAWGVSPGKIMLAALAILLAALLLRPFVPGMFGLLAWAGLIIFIVAYGMVFLRPSKSPVDRKMWRGKYIDEEPSGGNSWWQGIKRRFRK